MTEVPTIGRLAAAFLAISGFSLALGAGGYGRASTAAPPRLPDDETTDGAATLRRRPPDRLDWRRWARRLQVL